MRALAIFFLLIFALPGWALDITHDVSDMRPIFPMELEIEMTGDLVEGDADRLLAVFSRYPDHDFRSINLTLNSPGGSLAERLLIAHILRERPEITIATVGTPEVPDAICASACVLVYLGADLRYLGEDGRIGVHQFFDPTGDIPGGVAMDLAQRASADIMELLRAQRVDLAFFSRMTSTSRGIDWVPRELLARWRVVTGPIFDERMEYKNINGRVGLHMIHESLFGTNQMTLFCANGMLALAVLEEPELAVFGSLSFVLDGKDHMIDDYEVLNRENGRTRVVFRLPEDLMPFVKRAETIGARVFLPSEVAFWGFEQTIRDQRVSETVDGCLRLASGDPEEVRMTDYRNTDLFGADLTWDGVRGISFRACKAMCMANQTCRAVSYVRAKRWCWPKSFDFDRRGAEGVWSAIKR